MRQGSKRYEGKSHKAREAGHTQQPARKKSTHAQPAHMLSHAAATMPAMPATASHASRHNA